MSQKIKYFIHCVTVSSPLFQFKCDSLYSGHFSPKVKHIQYLKTSVRRENVSVVRSLAFNSWRFAQKNRSILSQFYWLTYILVMSVHKTNPTWSNIGHLILWWTFLSNNTQTCVLWLGANGWTNVPRAEQSYDLFHLWKSSSASSIFAFTSPSAIINCAR